VDLEHELATAEGDTRPRPGDRPEQGRLRVFHASDHEGALAIKAEGFRDAPADGHRAGVRVTDRPPASTGGEAHVLFAVDLPEEAIAGYQEQGSDGVRLFLLPAHLLNRHGPPIAEGEWSE
jgi:hypothetical protein